jgi:hypothetical protein
MQKCLLPLTSPLHANSDHFVGALTFASKQVVQEAMQIHAETLFIWK